MDDKQKSKKLEKEFKSKLENFSEKLNNEVDVFFDDLSRSFNSNYLSSIKPDAFKEGLIGGNTIVLQKGIQKLGIVVKIKATVITVPNIFKENNTNYLLDDWASMIEDALNRD